MSSSNNIPENSPENCPGTQSENAGKASACAGCPNQSICSSGVVKGPDPGIALVKESLKDVKHKILVLSGKGGVGKSTVTALLSRAVAAWNSNLNVAILDVDICGPSQPRVMGVLGEQVHQSGSGWSPVYVEENLSVMSIGFLLSSVDDAIIWRGPKKNGMIQKFLTEVDWGNLDFLFIDTPPGTSDEHLSLSTYLSQANVSGAVIVTTPQEIALLDVRKEIDFCRKVNINILGVVENMSMFVCPCCKDTSEIFAPTTGGAKQMCTDLNVPFLGGLPLDPSIAKSCDEGSDIMNEYSESVFMKDLRNIVENLIQRCREVEA